MALTILGGTRVSQKAAVAYYRAIGASERFIDEFIPLYYELAPLYDLPAETGLQQSSHETGRGRYTGVVDSGSNNPAGIKTSAGGGNYDPKAHYRFPTLRAGVQAHLSHLSKYGGKAEQAMPGGHYRSPRLHHVVSGIAVYVQGLGGKYAPSLEYGTNLERLVGEIRAYADEKGESLEGRLPVAGTRIALAAGHRNTDRGNTVEMALTAEHCYHAAKRLREAGADVRVVTPNEGRGMFAGGLQGVAQVVVDWHRSGWQPDLFIEFHTNGPGGRGVFTIYPDTGADVDTHVRDRVGPRVSELVAARMGIPVFGNGLMSERNTGVGRQGHRLGVFYRSQPIAGTCTRFIIESGFHSDPADLRVLKHAETPKRIADGLTAALSEFYDLDAGATPEPVGDPNARHFEETGHWIVNGEFDGVRVQMLEHWETLGGVGLCGYPISGMNLDSDGVYRQLCENVILEFWPEHHRYRIGAIGRRYRDLSLDYAALESEHEDCECS